MIKELVKKLKEDKDTYRAWRDNIAVQFEDAFNQNKKKYKNKEDIREISNMAAENFLNLLIS